MLPDRATVPCADATTELAQKTANRRWIPNHFFIECLQSAPDERPRF
jgi:hypothetical protein